VYTYMPYMYVSVHGDVPMALETGMGTVDMLVTHPAAGLPVGPRLRRPTRLLRRGADGEKRRTCMERNAVPIVGWSPWLTLRILLGQDIWPAT
jgi:hypothetical protein